jgi:hypothetical protein
METIQTDQDVDQLVWSIIQESRNPHDFLNYVRHAEDRDAGHDAALDRAQALWPTPADAPSFFPQVIAAMEALAEDGNTTAMFHLGRWYRLGFGVAVCSETGLRWYERGAQAGDARCLLNIARHTAQSNPAEAAILFQRCVEMGHSAAHSYWADLDMDHHVQHLYKGTAGGSAFSIYCYGHYLVTKGTPAQRTEGLDWVRKAGEAGNAMACLFMAHECMYPKEAADHDLKAAMIWLFTGIRYGGMGCMGMLGRQMTLAGDNKMEPGMRLLAHAAMLGDGPAQANLGFRLLWWGKSVDEQAQGIAWLESAATQDNKMGIYRLGEAHEKGRGTPVDNAKAAELYERGVQMGNVDCQAALGRMLYCGSEIAQDLERAHELFHLASLQGDANGTYLLGISYSYGGGTKKDDVLALECFTQAAELGDEAAAFRIGRAHLMAEGTPKNLGAAVMWFKKAARKGSTNAKLYLGLILIYEEQLGQSYWQAAKWLKEAAQDNDPRALRELGLLHASGKGVEKDVAETQRLMARAAGMGDKEAGEWLQANCPEKPEWLQKLVNEISG